MFAQELEIIRRFLRDPAGKLWDADLLIELWNESAAELQTRANVLEDIAVVSVPPRFSCAYLHEWERQHLSVGSTRNKALRSQGGHVSLCWVWESQEFFDLEADIGGDGSTCTHPWEAWFIAEDMPPEFPLPADFSSARGVYYDNRKIEYLGSNAIAGVDPSWNTRTGEPECYTRDDGVSRTFRLYPTPTTAAWNDETGSGMVTSVAGDTTNSELGTFAARTGTVFTSGLGAATTVLESDDNVTIIYRVRPVDVTGTGDPLQWPEYLRRYVRYGVLARAYMANNDGRILSLSRYWQARSTQGVEVVRRYLRNRKADRHYRLSPSTPSGGRQQREPRLPDTFPGFPV